MIAKNIFHEVTVETIGSPAERAEERIKTLGEHLELETKVDLITTDQAMGLVRGLKRRFGISKRNIRKEWHHVFADSPKEYHGIILIEGSTEVWVRSKSRGEVLRTLNRRLPVFLRGETKINPRSPNYTEYLHRVLQCEQVGSFDKGCVDLSFWVGELSFTATLSLASKDNRECCQMELEYDGHMEGSKAPDRQRIMTVFEQVAVTLFPGEKFSITTKLEWLLSSNPQLAALAPRYD